MFRYVDSFVCSVTSLEEGFFLIRETAQSHFKNCCLQEDLNFIARALYVIMKNAAKTSLSMLIKNNENRVANKRSAGTRSIYSSPMYLPIYNIENY